MDAKIPTPIISNNIHIQGSSKTQSNMYKNSTWSGPWTHSCVAPKTHLNQITSYMELSMWPCRASQHHRDRATWNCKDPCRTTETQRVSERYKETCRTIQNQTETHKHIKKHAELHRDKGRHREKEQREKDRELQEGIKNHTEWGSHTELQEFTKKSYRTTQNQRHSYTEVQRNHAESQRARDRHLQKSTKGHKEPERYTGLQEGPNTMQDAHWGPQSYTRPTAIHAQSMICASALHSSTVQIWFWVGAGL